jgi:carboxymethylenebutenolidase
MKVELQAADGPRLGAWVARPPAQPRGGLVVVQEIFGVNSHISAVADGFAADGWLAVAPALFDRVERDVELGYTPADIARGRTLRAGCAEDAALADIAAAREHAARAGKVGIVGYCWGGLISWLAACRLYGLDAAVVYYGGGVPDRAAERPRCPVLAHFGERDDNIPLAGVRALAAKQPAVELHTYAAGHGFNCDQRGSYDAAAAALARERTLAFLTRHLGSSGSTPA